MRVRWLVLAVLAGCSFSHGTSATGDATGNGSDAPPSDALADTTMVTTDAPPDTPPPPTDTDSDTVPDTTDNCPTVANTNQRDHDGDNHGDVCDHCPHLASTADPDGDGDGVGDACDPRPGMAGDSIALFEGFYDATSISTWDSQGGGTWSVAGGVLTQSVATTSTTNRTLSPPITVARAAITTSSTVLGIGVGGNGFSAPYVSLVAGVASNQSYWCSVVREGMNNKLYASAQSGGPFSFPSTDWPGTFAVNSTYRLTLALLGGNNVCTALEGAATTATVQGNTGGLNGAVQLATRSASASFDYVFVVSIGN